MLGKSFNKLSVIFLGLMFILVLTALQQTPPSLGISQIAAQENIGVTQPQTLTQLFSQLGIVEWQAQGFSGDSIRIGILNIGFGGLGEWEEEYDAQISLFPSHRLANYGSDPINTGINTLEIIYSVVPDAEFYLCRYQNPATFAACVSWFRTSDVDVVNHSGGVPIFYSNLENVVETASDMIWINEAGNYGRGIFQESFTDTDANTFHEFSSASTDETFGILPPSQVPMTIAIQWNDPFTDLEIEVIDADGNVLPALYQSSSLDYEVITIQTDQVVGLKIWKRRGNHDITITAWLEFVTVPAYASSEAITPSGRYSSVITVGALRDDQIALYSPVFETSLAKPDIFAPAAVLLDNNRFAIGTSVAAALVTGAIALIKEANPEWLPSDINDFLLEDAVQGADEAIYGYGRLFLPTSAEMASNDTTGMGTASEQLPLVTATNGATFSINIRSGDSTAFSVVKLLLPSESVRVVGISRLNSGWLYVEFPTENGEIGQGWVSRGVVIIDGDTTLLPLIDPPTLTSDNSAPPTTIPATAIPPTLVFPTVVPSTAGPPSGAFSQRSITIQVPEYSS